MQKQLRVEREASRKKKLVPAKITVRLDDDARKLLQDALDDGLPIMTVEKLTNASLRHSIPWLNLLLASAARAFQPCLKPANK